MASQSQYQHHPLPSPPQQAQLQYDYQQQYEQPGQAQPRRPSAQTSSSFRQSQAKPRTFSFHSDKSHKSSGSKTDFHETPAEKESRRLHSKADPTLAISEAEPSAVAAAMTQSSVVPLRSIQHRDPSGNPIADPDRSNPTRNRWERPLDTIRSFEAAIDGSYSRKSLYRADSVANWNRRSSYQPASQPRFRQESYYAANRPASMMRHDYAYDSAAPSARNSVYDMHGMGGGGSAYGLYGQQPAPARQRAPRMQSEPHTHYPGGQSVYPMPNKDRSYETVTSAAASGNSDHAGYQTDPTSSDNSSIDRRSPATKRQEPTNDYGIAFSQAQSYQAPNFSINPQQNGQHPLPPPPGNQNYPQQVAPAVPRKDAPVVLRRQPPSQRTEVPEKRKSWFARRFSKNP